jgi:hypothetical protein
MIISLIKYCKWIVNLHISLTLSLFCRYNNHMAKLYAFTVCPFGWRLCLIHFYDVNFTVFHVNSVYFAKTKCFDLKRFIFFFISLSIQNTLFCFVLMIIQHCKPNLKKITTTLYQRTLEHCCSLFGNLLFCFTYYIEDIEWV